MSVNKIILLGHTGKDPEIFTFDGGSKKAAFSLACSEKGYTTKGGVNVPDRTEWFTIVAFGSLAEICEKYVGKGDKIYIEGKVRTRSYDSNGQTRYVTEVYADKIELLGGKSDAPPKPKEFDDFTPEEAGYEKGINADDDGLPF